MRKKRNESVRISRNQMAYSLVRTRTTQEQTGKAKNILVVSWKKLKFKQPVFSVSSLWHSLLAMRMNLLILCDWRWYRSHPKIRTVGMTRDQYLSVCWLLKIKGRPSE